MLFNYISIPDGCAHTIHSRRRFLDGASELARSLCLSPTITAVGLKTRVSISCNHHVGSYSYCSVTYVIYMQNSCTHELWHYRLVNGDWYVLHINISDYGIYIYQLLSLILINYECYLLLNEFISYEILLLGLMQLLILYCCTASYHKNLIALNRTQYSLHAVQTK
jgi:hypothetical protein